MSYDPNQPQQPPYGQPPYGQPGQSPPFQPQQPPYGQPEQPYAQTQYGLPPVPGYVQPQQQPPKKGSLRWLWITLAIIGGLVVLGCGGCAVAGAFGIGFLAKTVAAPINTADQYYKAIQNQDYNKAYSYLDVSTITVGGETVNVSQSTFAQAASAVDTAKGKVSSYTIGSTSINNSAATIIVTVTRNGQSYPVTLNLRDEGNNTWKIVSFDSL